MIYNRFSAPVLFCFLLRLLKGPKPPFFKQQQKNISFFYSSSFERNKQAGVQVGYLKIIKTLERRQN